MENKVHDIQSQILLALQLKSKARFSELNKSDLTNDHFTFHINQLKESGLIEKCNDGLYQLTNKGKILTSRYDSESKKIETQAKLSVLVVCVRKNKGKTEYLVHQRLKSPFHGYYGFMAGKIVQGETVEETATRELLEETGLKGKLALVAVHHKMDYSEKKELLEDKFFFIFKAEDVRGELISEFEGGRNVWMTAEKLLKIDNIFDGVRETLDLIHKNRLAFIETKYDVKGF